jgi:hypothetical protein
MCKEWTLTERGKGGRVAVMVMPALLCRVAGQSYDAIRSEAVRTAHACNPGRRNDNLVALRGASPSNPAKGIEARNADTGIFELRDRWSPEAAQRPGAAHDAWRRIRRRKLPWGQRPPYPRLAAECERGRQAGGDQRGRHVGRAPRSLELPFASLLFTVAKFVGRLCILSALKCVVRKSCRIIHGPIGRRNRSS